MFQGRSVQGVEKTNVKGLDENSSIIAIGQGSAVDMDNFEVDLSGAIKLKMGRSLVYDFGVPIRYMGSYFSTDGVEVWVAVAGTSFYEAATPYGPWTLRSTTQTISATDGPWISAELNGKFVLVNGVDAPLYHTPNSYLNTLKMASLVAPPDGLSLTVVGASASSPIEYVLTSITANGESFISSNVKTVAGPNLSGSEYINLAWITRGGAQGYNIYRSQSAAGNVPVFYKIASVGKLTNAFSDTGYANGALLPTTLGTSTNTPAIWDTTPPTTIATIARGRAQRMIATVGTNMQATALSDPLDWETPSDAFSLPIRGGTDNVIRAIGALYDYTLLMSDTNTFVYTGSSYNDFNQVKILNIGCRSPNSLVSAGDELYFWSDLGPNSLSRVQYGQDLETNQPFSLPISRTVSSLSNKSYWSKIVAWKDVNNLRIAWAYPNGTGTSNSKALLRGTVQPGWSRHSVPAIVSAVVAEDRTVYVGCEDGKIYKLNDGYTDNGAMISGYYETGWYDSQSNLNKYIDNLTVITDKSLGAYQLTVQLYWDFADTANSTHTLTETTTDGVLVENATNTANTHILYTQGMGKFFKIRFSAAESTTPPRILGWREEMYTKGRR